LTVISGAHGCVGPRMKFPSFADGSVAFAIPSLDVSRRVRIARRRRLALRARGPATGGRRRRGLGHRRTQPGRPVGADQYRDAGQDGNYRTPSLEMSPPILKLNGATARSASASGTCKRLPQWLAGWHMKMVRPISSAKLSLTGWTPSYCCPVLGPRFGGGGRSPARKLRTHSKPGVAPVLAEAVCVAVPRQRAVQTLRLSTFRFFGDARSAAKNGPLAKVRDKIQAGRCLRPRCPGVSASDASAITVDRHVCRKRPRTRPPDPGVSTARRLNRGEFNNTIRDFLGVTDPAGR
jgi:hypothetical protein